MATKKQEPAKAKHHEKEAVRATPKTHAAPAKSASKPAAHTSKTTKK